MSHWLEEAESKISDKNNRKTAIKDRIEIKKEEVKENRILIEIDYQEIVDQFLDIIERINNLPRQSRIPFGSIHSKAKENKLHNLLYKFYSSRRISSKEFNSIMSPFKTQQYKNTRTFFISIGRKKNHLLIEYKEIKAKRKRINDEETSIWQKLFSFRSSIDKASSSVSDQAKNIHIDSFTDQLIMEHIDWLAFKVDELPLRNSIK